MVTLTAQQLEAVRAMRWWMDDGEETRRTGRTTALAVLLLCTALDRPGEWVTASRDHHYWGSPEGRGEWGPGSVVVSYAMEMALDLGLTVERRGKTLRVMGVSVEGAAWRARVLEGPGAVRQPEAGGEAEVGEKATVWSRLMDEE